LGGLPGGGLGAAAVGTLSDISQGFTFPKLERLAASPRSAHLGLIIPRLVNKDCSTPLGITEVGTAQGPVPLIPADVIMGFKQRLVSSAQAMRTQKVRGSPRPIPRSPARAIPRAPSMVSPMPGRIGPALGDGPIREIFSCDDSR
jgi:hypothetical protein